MPRLGPGGRWDAGFTDTTAVRFGSKQAVFTVVSDTEIQTAAPGGLSGHMVYVTVTTPDGTTGRVTASAYAYR